MSMVYVYLLFVSEFESLEILTQKLELLLFV